MRTRHQELMWPALPISTSYSEPYLFIYTEKSVDIYDVPSGMWLQSLPLSNTRPLSQDGSILFSQDSELVKNHCPQLIYLTQENRSILCLSIPISDPINFRHVSHIGKETGERMLRTFQDDRNSKSASASEINQLHTGSLDNGGSKKILRDRRSDITLPTITNLDKLAYFL
jgi:hypothetical protein